MEIEVNCIEADVPTKNGRIYSKECLEKMTGLFNEKIKESHTYIYFGDISDDGGNDVHKIVGKANECKIVDNKIVIDANLFGFNSFEDFAKGKLGVSSSNLDVTPQVIGDISNHKVTIDKVDCFRVILKQ
jgi:hypothetical protein